MTQPVSFSWATSNVADSISGTPNKVQPQAILTQIGFTTGQQPSAQNINYVLNLIGQWISYLNVNAAPSPASFSWVNIVSNATATASTGYIVEEGASLVTVTLPSTSVTGNSIAITSMTAPLTTPAVQGFQVVAPAGQYIQCLGVGAQSTIVFNQTGSTVFLLCVIPNSLWSIIFMQGNPST